ncbi:HTH-type transcriptional regulator ChbR [compost metagenome]
MKTLADDGVVYDVIEGENSFNKTTKCTYFLIVLFLDGSGIHYIDGKQHPIGKNQLHFLFPGQHHHWETGPETVAQKITVGKLIFEEFSSIEEFRFIRHNLPPVFKIDSMIFDAVDHEMKGIKSALELFDFNKGWHKLVLKRMDSLSTLMKYEAERYIDASLSAKLNPIVKNFWNLINTHYTEQRTTSWYADQLSISANYLNVLCQKNLNISASEMINQRIMQEAKQQLRFTDKIIKEIAFDLGFKSISTFSVFFKKQSGYSPINYRE